MSSVSSKMVKCGMNGFGRFGLHFLYNYLENKKSITFDLTNIHDEVLTIDDAFDIICNDKFVRIPEKHNVSVSGDRLVFDNDLSIRFSSGPDNQINWVGEPDLFLECSGKNTTREKSARFLSGNTKSVLISATSMDCDQTLIFGFNHHELSDNSSVISYGSCTVNSFVPLASRIKKLFGLNSAEVNVIHNLPEYKLSRSGGALVERRYCTLSASGIKLLSFLNENNFNVNYTLVPYSGVSVMDFTFELDETISKNDFFHELFDCTDDPYFPKLYELAEADTGPDSFKLKSHNAALVRATSKVLGKRVLLHSYFDNENSAVRFIDLVGFLASKVR